jgi:hypothetical protein
MDRNKILHDACHLGVPSGASKKISELMVRSARTDHQSRVKTSTISNRTETSFHLSFVTLDYHLVRPKSFLGLWYIWCNTISGAMVHLVQTVHLSCTETNTVSERTETSFHLSLVTQEYHPMHPKQFLTLQYVWHKPCTYLELRLALYPNGPK